MFMHFINILTKWRHGTLRKQFEKVELTANSVLEVSDGSITHLAATPIPVDPYLYERVRAQWQFGDWPALLTLKPDAVQTHPERAKIALLMASAHMQTGNNLSAKQYIKLAQDWGCDRKLLSQVMIATVHNTLGRACLLDGRNERSITHFTDSLKLATRGAEVPLMTQARVRHQSELLGLSADENSLCPPNSRNRSSKASPLRAQAEQARHVIRTIQHLSCTGGTLFTKCIAAQPKVVLLNEIDPYSSMSSKPNERAFNPRDIMANLQQGYSTIADEIVEENFVEQVQTLVRQLQSDHSILVLREHSHGAYLVGSEPRKKRSFRPLLAERFLLRSILTVRDPIDSYLGLLNSKWVNFSPSTFDEYCKRYLQFILDNCDIRLFRYEDFVRDSPVVMKQICRELDLEFSSNFATQFGKYSFSGDSGRTGHIIVPRERRAYTDGFADEVNQSSNYRDLADKLGYEKQSLN